MKRPISGEGKALVVTLPTTMKQGDVVPDWLRASLRRMYSDVMTEPIPEDLVNLLQQLQSRYNQSESEADPSGRDSESI